MKNVLCVFLFVGALFAFSAAKVSAATINVIIPKSSFTVGEQFTASIRIDTDVGVNATQGTLQFPKDMLEVLSVDKADSIFSFWLQGPDVANDAGTVTFVGGSVSGFTGKALLVLRVNFKVKGGGQGDILLTDGAATASDGSGTDLLTGANGATVKVIGKNTPALPTPVTGPAAGVLPPVVIPTEVPPAPLVASPPVVLPPVQIVRTPEPASGAPIKPAVDVPLYPDSKQWYGLSAIFLAKWVLPADITAVATEIDKNPAGSPTKSEGLFDNKTFAALADGVWYLHVRFKNSIGWGPTAHYRLAIDTAPPLAFDVISEDGTPTNNPAPTISFAASDRFSQIDYYLIKVDSGRQIKTSETKYHLPLLPPGEHSISVIAHDAAGNMTETVLKLNILPLTAPIITSYSQNVYANEGNLFITGESLPDLTVLFAVRAINNATIYSTSVSSTHAGTWVVNFNHPLLKGKYYIEVLAEDGRGALSFPVKSDTITVGDRPFLTIFNIQISEFGFFCGVILILIGAFGAGLYTNRLAKVQRGRKALIAERDVANAYTLIKKDVDKMIESYKDGVITEDDVSRIKFLLKRVSDNTAKMQKYIVQSVKEIED